MKESKHAAIMRNVAQILVQAKVDLSTVWRIPLLDEQNLPLTGAEMKEMFELSRKRKEVNG